VVFKDFSKIGEVFTGQVLLYVAMYGHGRHDTARRCVVRASEENYV